MTTHVCAPVILDHGGINISHGQTRCGCLLVFHSASRQLEEQLGCTVHQRPASRMVDTCDNALAVVQAESWLG